MVNDLNQSTDKIAKSTGQISSCFIEDKRLLTSFERVEKQHVEMRAMSHNTCRKFGLSGGVVSDDMV